MARSQQRPDLRGKSGRRSRRGGLVKTVKIEVVDNQIEPALKALKKEMLKGGVFKEMKRRAYYEKPSVKRKRKQAEARRKRRKALKRQSWTGTE
jgi:small subunit ribosomal protein S21